MFHSCSYQFNILHLTEELPLYLELHIINILFYQPFFQGLYFVRDNVSSVVIDTNNDGFTRLIFLELRSPSKVMYFYLFPLLLLTVVT